MHAFQSFFGTDVPYNSRPSDVVMRVVDIARQHLWRIVSSTPESGYRKYYLHLSPLVVAAAALAAATSALGFTGPPPPGPRADA
jgi:hypothetical protein